MDDIEWDDGPVLARQQTFALQPKDHISIIGNTLAERMQYDGWLETMLQARFPKHELVVRNLGFSGDEIDTRLRSKNFGTPDEWLSGLANPIGGYEDNRFAGTNTKADVVFAFFGYNESYAGRGGARGVQERAGRLDHAHARAEIQRHDRRRGSSCSRPSPTRTSAIPTCPTARRTTSASRSTRTPWRRSPRPRRRRRSSICSRRAEALRRDQGAADDQGVHLNSEGNRQIAQVIDRDALRRARPSTTRPCSRGCGRPSSTRIATGSTATA